MKSSAPKLLAAALAVAGFAATASAATLTWTNTAGGNWSNPMNWSPNEVPGQLNILNSSDDVLITNAGTYTVVLDEGTSPNFWDIQSLTLGAGHGNGVQTLAVTNKILYVAPMTITNGGVLVDNHSSFHAVITIASGGQLNSTNGTYFANPFTVGSGGTFTTRGSTTLESGGSLEIAGMLSVSNGTLTVDMPVTNSGTMNVSAGAGLSVENLLNLLGPLTNSGTMSIGGNGAISISNNLSTALGGLVNLANGVINLNNANGITGGNNHEFFINQGTINSASGGQIQAIPGFTNSGAIYVTANTLNLDSGLHLQSSGSLNVQLNNAASYGKIAINGSAALTGAFNVTLGNGFNPQNGNSFQPLTYSSGHSGIFTSTNLPTLVPWQMTYDSSAVTLSVTTRTITWINTSGGNWSDPNNWSPNIVPGGTLYGNSDDAVITNAGTYTVVFDEGTISSPYYLHGLTLGGSEFQTLIVSNKRFEVGTMAVNFGGIVNSTSNYWFNNWVSPLTINDRGFFNSTNDLFDQDVTVNGGGNFSAVNSTNGNGAFTINLNGALNIPTGAFVLNSNGHTTNSGTITISSGASLSINDNLALLNSGYLWNKSGGTINLAGNHGISGDNGAEVLSNEGMINSSGGYIQSVPDFSNSGTINAVSGTLDLDSGLQLQSSGSLNSQFNGAGNYGVIVISGNAALAGTFGVTLNYTPAAGDSFTPLTYSSYSGSFTAINLPALGIGQSWQTTLGTQALTLQVAESVNWTNTAGGNWSDPNNWNPNLVPGQFDDVGITTPGTYIVNVDTSPSVKSLTLGTGGSANGTNTLSVVSKTFYVNPLTISAGGILTNNNSTFHAVITVQNGGQLNSFNGTYYANPLTIASGGVMNSSGNDLFHQSFVIGSGGILNSTGSPFIENDGSMTVDEGGIINIPVNVLNLYGPMTNSGTVNIAGNGGIYIYNNGTTQLGYLVNQPGGVVNLNGDNGIQVGPFINQGSIVSTGNGVQILTSLFDTSAGTVTNLNGTLHLSYFTNTLAGIFYATNNATIQFNGGTIATPLKPGNPLTLAGNGIFQFQSGWLDFPTNIVSNLDLRGGFLELEPTFQGGAITNLALDGIDLTNFNHLPVTNGILAATNGSIYGNLTVQSSGQLIVSGTELHANVTVAAGGQLTPPGAAVESDGSLTMDGTLNLIGSDVLTLYGPMTNSGTINLPGNSGIYIYDNQTAGYLGGLVNLPAGIINITGNNGIQGGNFGDEYFVNQGTVISTVGGQVAYIAGFTNAGVINSLSGTMTIHPVTLLSTGSLNSRLNSKTDYGKFSISGNVALNGTFGVTLNGYLPTNGTSFNVLSTGSYSGSFDLLNLPAVVTWLPQYNSTTFSLVVGQPQFAASLLGTNLIFNANGGTSGNKGVLFSSTNLTLPLAQWIPTATNTFDLNGQFAFTNSVDFNQPKQFFILEYQ